MTATIWQTALLSVQSKWVWNVLLPALMNSSDHNTVKVTGKNSCGILNRLASANLQITVGEEKCLTAELRIDDEFLKNVNEKSKYIKNFLKNVNGVKSISGMGLMLGIEAFLKNHSKRFTL